MRAPLELASRQSLARPFPKLCDPRAPRRQRRPSPRRRIAPAALWWWMQSEGAEEAPPKPNPQFKKKDLLRIKRDGPTIDDLVHKHVKEVTDSNTGYTKTVETWHVPNEVLGDSQYSPEPDWFATPQVSMVTLLRGLKERNWTSDLYNPNAEPWKIEFFSDSGRFLCNSFSGYRALITKADGSRMWCDMPDAGPPNFLEDYISGGGIGAIHTAKRLPPLPDNPLQYGYNQAFLEVFQAFEQRLPKKAIRHFEKYGWVDQSKFPYDCPGDSLLDVSFHQTPPELNLAPFWEKIPGFLFFGFAFSFLGVCLAIGIFRPRRMMPGDPVQAMEFAQSKGQARKEGMTGVKFSDIAGLDSTLSELQEVVEFLKSPKRYASLNAKPPKGVLLEGAPGTGKTMIAKAIAGESNVPFYQMSGSEFVEVIVGVGAARVRDLFKRARVNAPCIIFVDEIDALAIRRAEAGMKTNEEREQTLNQLLTEMDGFTPDIGVVFVAATNRADLLDPALMRAGRFDRKVRVLRPNTDGRAAILRVHARKHPVDPDVDFTQIAKDLPGLTGAELANILNEAALETLRRDGNLINTHDIYSAIDRILQGVRRPSFPKSFDMMRAISVFETGRAVVATELRRRNGLIEAVDRISIVPRGKDLSRTLFLRGSDENYSMTTRSRLLERVRVVIAGRAAEEVYFGREKVTNYGIPSIKDAYKLAEKVVASYGMTDLGITTWAPPSKGPSYKNKTFEPQVDNIDADLFGSAIEGSGKFFQPSNSAVYKIRSATQNIVNDAYDDCAKILESYSEALAVASQELLDNEQISGQRLQEIMAEHPPRPLEDVERSLEAKEIAAGERLSLVSRSEIDLSKFLVAGAK